MGHGSHFSELSQTFVFCHCFDKPWSILVHKGKLTLGQIPGSSIYSFKKNGGIYLCTKCIGLRKIGKMSPQWTSCSLGGMVQQEFHLWSQPCEDSGQSHFAKHHVCQEWGHQHDFWPGRTDQEVEDWSWVPAMLWRSIAHCLMCSSRGMESRCFGKWQAGSGSKKIK